MNKPLFYPDRVLSLVVLVLSTLMIAGSAYLYNIRNKFDDHTAQIVNNSERSVQIIKLNRAIAAEVQGAATEAEEIEE